jgi:hypothetical protein
MNKSVSLLDLMTELCRKSADPYVTSITSCGAAIPATTTNFGNQTRHDNILNLT